MSKMRMPRKRSVLIRSQVVMGLLSLTTAVEATTDIFDLAGRRVRRVRHAAVGAGLVETEWDGCDEAGHTVPPGSYLYRIAVDSDGGEEARVGHVAVAY